MEREVAGWFTVCKVVAEDEVEFAEDLCYVEVWDVYVIA